MGLSVISSSKVAPRIGLRDLIRNWEGETTKISTDEFVMINYISALADKGSISDNLKGTRGYSLGHSLSMHEAQRCYEAGRK